MRWFRFYDDAINDPKVQRLAPNLFKTWVNLLCLASKSGGKLPSDDDIAFLLRVSVQDAAQQLQDLILAGLIDIGPRGERVPHNWLERQYASDSSAERTRKYRTKLKEKTCDVTGDGEVTVQSQTQSQNREESQGLLHNQASAKAKTEGIDSGFGKGKVEEGIVRRARDLDVPVDEYLATMLAAGAKIKKPAGYFVKCCIEHLRTKIPTKKIPDKIMNDAIYWGDEKAKGQIISALLEVV